MSEELQAEFEDLDGQRRRLSREELLGFVNLLASAGNETTTRLIGWMGKVLAEHPEQRRQLVNDPSRIPFAIEELLRYESPSPVQARYVSEDVEHHGTTVKAGSFMLLLTGAANRDERRFPERIASTSSARSGSTSPSSRLETLTGEDSAVLSPVRRQAGSFARSSARAARWPHRWRARRTLSTRDLEASAHSRKLLLSP
jgi:hypothetical protein